MCSVQWSVTDARHCVKLHPNLCTPEWDLPGTGSDYNNEWSSVSPPWTLRPSCYARRLPIDTCLVSKKFYKSPLTKYVFGVAMGGPLLKLQNFKKVKLIFGHPVNKQHFCWVLWLLEGSITQNKKIKRPFPLFQLFFGSQKSQNIWSNIGI